MNSRRRKYVKWALKYQHQVPSLIPIFPIELKDLMRYVLYLSSPEGNIRSGWKACQNLVSDICTWSRLRGWRDPRHGEHNAFLWSRFRKNFRTEVQVCRTVKKKLCLTPAHLQAIVATLDLDNFEDLKWATTFVTLWHASARVGHVAPKSRKDPRHVWRFEDISFEPTLQDASSVLINFRSSKTRAPTEDRQFWTAVGAVQLQRGQPCTCPVRLLQRWFKRAYKGHPQHPLFGAKENTSLAITRTSFTSMLRSCLTKGAKYLMPPHDKIDCSEFSGISMRKGSLSAMSGVVEFNRLRERADHKCPESTQHYVNDSMQKRARSTVDVHSRFPSNPENTGEPPQQKRRRNV